ncbi:MAG: response regulator [Bacteroidota bacterium]|jgi:signal transduction histidine kinase|nr:response regulator [Bacteroidota bacterium]
MSTGIEILVVEDSPTQALKLKYILEKQDYLVRLATNGVEGLEAIAEKRPTLVISDVLMPEMDGYEFCTRVKNDPELSAIPVILLTTLSDPQDIIRGLESGADNFLNKPYSEEALLSRIKYILINMDVRTRMRTGMGIEIYFANKKHYLTSERIQIIDLLLSTYENAVEKNRELEQANKKLRMVQEEIERSNEQLKRLNEQKNMLLGMAAHDLRNPLYLIEGYSDFLLKENPPTLSDDQRTVIAAIHGSSTFMVGMINDLLDVHKIETGKMELKLEVGDFAQVLRTVIERQGYAVQAKGVEISLALPEGIPHFLFDPARIEQVMGNLIDNAIKFSFAGARIEVMVQYDDTEVRFSVRDYGPGIPEKELGRLFKPFSTTSVKPTGNEKSTGLGLAIAESIVTRHHGRIWVESEQGKGSQFSFALPVQQKVH